jgi:5-methylcytosine-specific restriction endonuclease McrA
MARFSMYELRLRERIFQAYNYCCAACGSPLDIEIDHTRPRKVLLAMGIALDDPRYLQCLCRHCNNRKNGTDGMPKLDPREPVDSCREILANREAFVNYLDEYRKGQD